MISFGGSDNNLNSFEKAKAVVLPVPYGKTVSYRKGTEKGPNAIMEASDKLELFDEELQKEVYRVGINTQEPVSVKDLSSKSMIDVVEKRVLNIYKNKKIPVVLGGEHSVTIGAVKAAKREFNDLSVLYFDSHYDLKDSYEGFKYSHACVARRLLEIAPIVEIGVRSLSKDEKDFLPNNKVKIISMEGVRKNQDWRNKIKNSLSKNVYISIDLDVFDPSIMPSVGTPEPGGFGWYEFLDAIRDVITNRNIVGFDVVELCPIKNMISADFMAARLIYKTIGYIFNK